MQCNCAKGLHFSAFHYYIIIVIIIMIKFLLLLILILVHVHIPHHVANFQWYFSNSVKKKYEELERELKT